MATDTQTVRVNLAERGYDIEIGADNLAGAGRFLADRAKVTHVVLVTDEHVQKPHAMRVAESFGEQEIEADVIVVELTGLHNTPRFARDSAMVYSQIVYACKSSDVRDVWCNGRALMRDRALLTVDLPTVTAQAQNIAQQIDTFLINREGNLLDKLIVIGGLNQEEMFEVQVKVAIENPAEIDRALKQPPISITRSSRRNQYDTYFLFADPQQGRVRYREDEILGQNGEVAEARYLLTYTQPAKEREFAQSILLSRARFTARADRSLRFYREYIRSSEERTVNKERQRYHIVYKDIAFMVNVDRMTEPALPGYFMEIKSRTWTRRDAEKKAALIYELLTLLGVTPSQVTRTEYVEF